MKKTLVRKIRRRLLKLRLQPIRVFCMHHVSDVYDPLTMWECDWVNTDTLKQWIDDMRRNGYQFISLPEAHHYLQHDFIRRRKYAVLTADDGFKTLQNILPWLVEQKIPITLFVNPKYIFEDAIGPNVQKKLDESHSTANSDIMYLKKEDIFKLQSPLLTLAHHGYEHFDSQKIDETTFRENIEKSIDSMKLFDSYLIPFYAYPYGNYNRQFDEIIFKHRLTPIYISGGVNYINTERIDRELISNERLENFTNKRVNELRS